MPNDRPCPDALDLVHLSEPIQEEGALEPSRGIQARRGGREANKQTAQDGDQEETDPRGEEREHKHLPGDCVQRRRLKVSVGDFRIRDRYELSGEPGNHGRGRYQEAEFQDYLHQDIESFVNPTRSQVATAICRPLKGRKPAGKLRRGALPHLVRTHVVENRCKRGDPGAATHHHIIGYGGPHSDLAAFL